MREKFMFFWNFMETANKLPDEMRLKYYDSIMDYVFKGIEPTDPVMAALINSIKPSLDKEEKRGGNHNPSGQNQHSEVKVGQNEVKVGQSGQSFLETETETETEKEKESVKKKVAIAPRFTKPSLDQVMAYCQERNNTVNAEQFMDFYESKGWRVGNQPMKDWKAAVRTWEKREQPKESPKIEYALPKTTTKQEIHEMLEQRKREDEETKQRAAEAQRRSDFIKSKGYASVVSLISAGKDVYDKVMAEYRQANGF